MVVCVVGVNRIDFVYTRLVVQPCAASNSNMQAAMEISAKYCHKELETYGSCVASNPTTWQQKCHDLKMKVSQCTSSHPVIQKIRQDCSTEFGKFEQCLKENQNTPTSCAAHVTRFLGCADSVDLSNVASDSSSE